MPIVKVSLDPTETTVQLDTNPIEIWSNATDKSIHWHLSGNAYGGEFIDFTWRGSKAPKKPKSGIFDDPTLSPQKKALTLKDNHVGDASKSRKEGWPYVLTFEVGGVTYQTGPTTIIQTSSATGLTWSIAGQDPIIKNN